MNRIQTRFDQMVRRWCRWLNDCLPAWHPLAAMGRRAAGLGQGFPLPVDRRTGVDVLMTYGEGKDKKGNYLNDGAMAKARTADAPKKYNPLAYQIHADFWAYCHMDGQPCVWCKGKNFLVPQNKITSARSVERRQDIINTQLCPPGKIPKNAWFGCCNGPNGLRLIAFMDCCGDGWCVPNPLKRVSNWGQAKNWCFSGDNPPPHGTFGGHTGAESYFCTVVVDSGECGD
jgi:hypothetical protein